MSIPLVQSVKDRIRHLAMQEKRSFANLWHTMTLERLLTRVAQSSHAHSFILKGGLLLAKYLPISRETRDIDFSVNCLANDPDSIKSVFSEILAVPTEDGFEFESPKAKVLSQPAMAYEGIRVVTVAHFGNTKTHVQIDLGFGKTAGYAPWEVPLLHTRQGPLFESHVKLQCYTRELIFAEKLQAGVERGGSNSRMKDYPDLFTLTTTPDQLAPRQTKQLVSLVFRMRNTSCETLPFDFSTNSLDRLQKEWKTYLVGSHVTPGTIGLPNHFSSLLDYVNEWLNRNLCPL